MESSAVDGLLILPMLKMPEIGFALLIANISVTQLFHANKCICLNMHRICFINNLLRMLITNNSWFTL